MKEKTLCLWSCTVSHMTILQKATKRLTKLLNAVQRVFAWGGMETELLFILLV
jgi:hypothetical protein